MKPHNPMSLLSRRRASTLLCAAPLAACGSAEVVWLPDRQRKALFQQRFKRIALLSFPPHSFEAAVPDLRYLVFEDRVPIVREFRSGPFRVVVTYPAAGFRQLFPAYDTVMRVKETLDASRQLSRALSSVPGDPYAHFAQRLAADLRDTGVEVIERNVGDPSVPVASMLKSLPEVDAVIEHQLGFGFVRANRREPFSPTLDVEFRIRSGKKPQSVLGEQYWSGSMSAGDPPAWPNLQRLLSQPQAAQAQFMQLAEGYAPHFALALRDERAWTFVDR